MDSKIDDSDYKNYLNYQPIRQLQNIPQNNFPDSFNHIPSNNNNFHINNIEEAKQPKPKSKEKKLVTTVKKKIKNADKTETKTKAKLKSKSKSKLKTGIKKHNSTLNSMKITNKEKEININNTSRNTSRTKINKANGVERLVTTESSDFKSTNVINDKLDMLIGKNSYLEEQLENQKNENNFLKNKLENLERYYDESARNKVVLKQLEEDYQNLVSKYEKSESLRNLQEMSLKNLQTELGKMKVKPTALIKTLENEIRKTESRLETEHN